MCVDDYPFRHFSAQRPKVCRKFVFVKEEEFAMTYYVNISQFEEFGDVALCKILLYLSNKGLDIKDKKFFLPKFNAIIEPYTFCRIIFEALDDKEIILKVYPSSKTSQQIFDQAEDEPLLYKEDPKDEENYFCRIEDVDAEEINRIFQLDKEDPMEQFVLLTSQDMESEKSGSDKMLDESEEPPSVEPRSSDNHRKIKEAERAIGQVISAVKTWRQLYETKRCNLTDGAKIVGISKKSLDDYYLVIRTGQIFGFDYASHLNEQMGLLRNFIRGQKQKVTGKLGKKVKCFDIIPEIDLDKLIFDFKALP